MQVVENMTFKPSCGEGFYRQLSHRIFHFSLFPFPFLAFPSQYLFDIVQFVQGFNGR